MYPMCVRASCVIGLPSKRTSPPSAASTPSAIRIVVVLPAPLLPTKPNSSPARTPNVIPSSASVPLLIPHPLLEILGVVVRQGPAEHHRRNGAAGDQQRGHHDHAAPAAIGLVRERDGVEHRDDHQVDQRLVADERDAVAPLALTLVEQPREAAAHPAGED